ncbi:hypothetical protein C8E01_1281 [Pontibacter virosus]|uniref:Uncharacterized protein n=1 Tax=Pontibacter virosus TaxID=1765052 RepID=A0A2U1AI40_9BACT|nr:hypothetical protein C8E01_1281 [Pontibacter virosus]
MLISITTFGSYVTVNRKPININITTPISQLRRRMAKSVDRDCKFTDFKSGVSFRLF